LVGELARELHGREPRAVQDLVGVGVADPAQDRGIGQEPLERMVLADEGGAEGLDVGLEHLEPARVVLEERRLAMDQMDGGAAPRAARACADCTPGAPPSEASVRCRVSRRTSRGWGPAVRGEPPVIGWCGKYHE